MNVIGETVTVVTSHDPGKVGMSGLVLLETAKTLVVKGGGRTFRVEKEGSVFRLSASGEVLLGSDLAGRLEDRLGRRSR